MARTKGSEGQATQARVFAAARKLFSEQGYALVGMREIAAETGIRVGGLYRYVDDKESLLFSIIQSHMVARRAACPVHEGDPVRDLEAMVSAQFDAIASDVQGAAITARDRVNLNASAQARIERLESEIIEHLCRILSDGRKTVFQLPDARAGAIAVLATIDAFAFASGEKSRLGGDRAKRISANFCRRIVKS